MDFSEHDGGIMDSGEHDDGNFEDVSTVAGDNVPSESLHAVNGDSYASRAARTSGIGNIPVNDLVHQVWENENHIPQRPKTAFFTLHRQTSARSVFDALALSNIEPTEIQCLQRKMNGEVVVTFKSLEAKDKFLGLNSC